MSIDERHNDETTPPATKSIRAKILPSVSKCVQVNKSPDAIATAATMAVIINVSLRLAVANHLKKFANLLKLNLLVFIVFHY